MGRLQQLFHEYGQIDCRDLSFRQSEILRNCLKEIPSHEICSAEDGRLFISLLKIFRGAVAENDKLHGENYPDLLNNILSVGADGVYSDPLRFVFELIQNVDDCLFPDPEDCKLDMRFDFNKDQIVLTYNEQGFSPFNVFAITGIAEAAKNINGEKNKIGEKGIGFKSVFGVANRVLIRSGWFSFELHKNNFTIPIENYADSEFVPGTQMTLFVPGKAKMLYDQIKDRYCNKEALFRKNPLLFLNNLTSLRLYFDTWRSMEFKVSRPVKHDSNAITREDGVKISVNLHDYDKNGCEHETIEEITCTRYTYPVFYDKDAYRSRYEKDPPDGDTEPRFLQAVLPSIDDVNKVEAGGLYSFLPTQLRFTVPIVCHAPFKLDTSREFVDPQDKEDSNGNLWFNVTASHLAEFLDKVFLDWAETVKQGIIKYLPSKKDNLFAETNDGNERCLSRLPFFEGKHYVAMPLFFSGSKGFLPADSIFCFSQDEQISEPKKVTDLLELKKALFIAPENVPVSSFGITIERNIKDRLFKQALKNAQLTKGIIGYLDNNGFDFREELFPTEEVSFDATQLSCFLQNNKMTEMLQKISIAAINRGSRPRFSIVGIPEKPIKEVPNCDFELNETPKQVENYMKFCGSIAYCLNISDGAFLPCKNGIVLSQKNPLDSFSSFCFEIDPNDTFAIRMRLREKSKQLDLCVENDSGSASEFLRDLMNIRLTVKDSLGKHGYKSYTNLIISSGTNRNRFLHELLQNADDCQYPEGTTPVFKLYHSNHCITTEYNEVGFTRANLRAITAIGESTKNSLIDGDFKTIGEKGVGFKSVFAVASEIKIFSGDYNFSLCEDAPTIPKQISGPVNPVKGTKMEFTLREETPLVSLKQSDILELCLCLRHLKNIEIDNHRVSISDTENQRTLTVDNRPYTFYKYIHHFYVENAAAIKQRGNNTRKISPQQTITCYVPVGTSSSEFPLYCGLPTKHRIRVPMAIDAPFELTTSREHIEESCNLWNDIIRKELYAAVVKVIHHRKVEERAKVLRFCRVNFQMMGNRESMYVNAFTDSVYLNSYNYLSALKGEDIIPTFDRNRFVSINEKHAFKYPDAVIRLLTILTSSIPNWFSPDSVIDSKIPEDISKEQRERIESVYKALGCEDASFSQVFPIIKQLAESNITDVAFRNSLYEYLKEAPTDYQPDIASLRILPVFGINGGIVYVCWNNNSIFVKRNTSKSTSAYWILNEDILPKSMCEQMLGVNINEMNSEWERNCYREKLEEIVRGDNINSIYSYLLREFQAGSISANNCRTTLLGLKELIPLKNELGEITDNELFVSSQPEGYFPVEIIQRITVHEECLALAKYISCRNLSDVYYEDFNYNSPLSEDEIECLKDDYFVHSEEILQRFYRNGYIAENLMKEYGIEYLGMSFDDDAYIQYAFPEQPVVDRQKLIAHIQLECSKPVSIVSETVERSILRGKRMNGESFDLDGTEARNRTLALYTPEDSEKAAFCQMCGSIKPHMLMEVNNIELKPKYYFPQTRVALCLDCSKRFESMRQDANKRETFLDQIKCTVITKEGKLSIPFGNEHLTFTATHLAEVQEILKWIQKK